MFDTFSGNDGKTAGTCNIYFSSTFLPLNPQCFLALPRYPVYYRRNNVPIEEFVHDILSPASAKQRSI